MPLQLVPATASQYAPYLSAYHVPLMQSAEWAQVKKPNWEGTLFFLRDPYHPLPTPHPAPGIDPHVLGLVSPIHVKDSKLGGTFCYTPRGPVLFLNQQDPRFPELAREAVRLVRDYAQTAGHKRLLMDPEWLHTPQLETELRSAQQTLGGKFHSYPEKAKGQLQFEMTGSVEGLTYDEWFSGLGSRMRSKIRKGLREGAQTEISADPALVDTFYRLVVHTCERQQIGHRPRDYFSGLLAAYPDAFFSVGSYDGEILSMSLNIPCSDTVTYLYAANELAQPKLNLPSIMVTEVFRETIARGHKYVALGGIHDTQDHLYSYKRLFVGEEGLRYFVGELEWHF